MDTSSNSSSESGFCKYCQVELNRENTSKVGRKSCITCNKNRLEQCKQDKQEQPDKICCSRCKKYYELDNFLKQVKQCQTCRNKAKYTRKSKKWLCGW